MTDADLKRALGTVLDREPLLSWRGWWTTHNETSEPPATFDRVRRETSDEFGLAQFGRAVAFIEAAPRTRTINRRHGCYGWKHAAERWHRTAALPYAGYYIGEGAFIAACIVGGLLICRQRTTTFTNLSERAWAMGDREDSL
jgi:hypothetical protein